MSQASLFKTPRRKKFEVPEPMVQEILYLIAQDYKEYVQYSHLQNSVPKFNIRAVRANYLAYALIPSSENTVELALIALDQFVQERFRAPLKAQHRYQPPIIGIVPQSCDVHHIFKRLIEKQQVLDLLSGQDDLSRVLRQISRLTKQEFPEVFYFCRD